MNSNHINVSISILKVLTISTLLTLSACQSDTKAHSSATNTPIKTSNQEKANRSKTPQKPIKTTKTKRKVDAQVVKQDISVDNLNGAPIPGTTSELRAKKVGIVSEKMPKKSGISDPKKTTKKAPAKKNLPKKKPKIKAAPQIEFAKTRYDFGTINQGDTVDYKFSFVNTGKAPLVIKKVKATCGCTQPSYPFIPIEPGEEGYIGVRYVSVGKEGLQKPLISVFSNAMEDPQALVLEGTVKVLPKDEKK